MNFFKKDFLSWTIFSIIGLLVIFLMFLQYVISSNIVNQILLSIIILIFLIGLYFSYKQQLLLFNEVNNVPSANNEKSIASYFTDEINEAGNSNNNTAGLVQEYSNVYFDNIGKYLNVISSISNLLITAGFLGTVFGLILAMAGLKGAVSNPGANTNFLIKELDTVLSGIDVAFYTTLFGAFGGGIVLRINLIIHKNCMDRIVASMRLKWLKICSAVKDNFNDIYYKEIFERKDALESIFQSISDNMNMLVINLAKSDEHIKDVADAIPERFKNVLESTNLIQNSGATLSEVLNSLLKDFNNMSDKISYVKPKLSDNIITVFEEVIKASDEVQRALPLFFDKLNIMVSNIENASGSMKNLDENIKQTFTSIKELTSSFKGTSVSVKDLEESMSALIALPAQKTLSLLADRIEENNQVITRELRGLLGR